MSNVDGRAVPLPSGDAVWESWVQHVASAKYRVAPNAYGRRGQRQDGIDFIVRVDDRRIGIQCKFVSQGSRLDVADVEADIRASAKIDPPIARFVLYTSAASDTKTVDALDALRPMAASQSIGFEFLMWRDFEEEVRTFDLFDRLEGRVREEYPTLLVHAAAKPPVEDRGVTAQSVAVRASSTAIYVDMLENVRELFAKGDVVAATTLVDLIIKRGTEVADSELARAYASKATMVARAGNVTEAAILWRKSAEIEPIPDRRIGRRAQALICEDRYAEALDVALPGLDVQPPSPLAALSALIGAQHVGRRAEIDARLSGRLKADRDVALVWAHTAMADGDLDVAEGIAADLIKQHPDDADVLGLRASLLLHRALGGANRLRASLVSGPERRAAQDAVTLFRKALAGRNPVAEKSVWLPTALNLVSALKLLGQHRDAAAVAISIVEHYRSAFDEVEQIALVLAEGGQENRALDLTDNDLSSAKRVMARTSALMHLQRFPEALAVLRAVPTGLDPLDADNLRWMSLAARLESEPGASLETLADEFYRGSHNKLNACKRIVENAASCGLAALGRRFAAKAVELHEQGATIDDVLFVADAYIEVDRKDQALGVLLPLIDLNHPAGGLLEERAAFCLLQLRRFESLGQLLDGLPADAPDLARFDPYRIDYALARRDAKGALLAVRNALVRRPTNFKLKAMEAHLLRETDSVEEAKQRLRAIEYQSGATVDGIAVYVHAATKLDEVGLSDDMAYRWIREHGDISENAAWFLSHVLLGRNGKEPDAHLPAVSRRCGVCLVGTTGDRSTHWLVIDDRFAERPAAGWFLPANSHVAGLSNRSVGDTVPCAAFPGGPFVLAAVTTAFDGAFALIQSRYGRDVPMTDALQCLSFKGQDEDFDFRPIFEMLDRNKAASEKALSVYAENPLPLGVLARTLGRHPIDLWGGLVGTERSLRATSGDAQSIERFANRCQRPRPAIVIDPITLLSWHAFGIESTATVLTSSIRMAASAVDLIRQKREEVERHGDRPYMVLAAGNQDGQYQRTDVTETDIESQRTFLDRVLEWIGRHVTVLPVPQNGLPEEVYSTMRLHWPAYIADTLQLAAHHNELCVVDDIGLELLAASSGVPQAPTIALWRGAASAGIIARFDLDQALLKLVGANYEFISLNAEDLLAATEPHCSMLSQSPGARSLIAYLRIRSLNVPSGLRLLFAYLRVLVNRRDSPSLVRDVIVAGLSALTRHATRDTDVVCETFSKFIERVLSGPYADAGRAALSSWRAGHFLLADG